MPWQQLAQHARNQINTSSLEDGQKSAVKHRTRTKWTVEMNFAVIEARNEAEEIVVLSQNVEFVKRLYRN